MRINKYIAESGYCSRRKADRLIEEGWVKINGKTAELGSTVEESDKVTIDGEIISLEGKNNVYIAYNKPVGIICTSDPDAKDNIIDAVGYPERIVHVGRLDVASSGLILLTNDGDIVNKILRAENGHEKEYVVTVDKKMTRAFTDAMKKGVVLDDQKTRPARLKKINDKKFKLVITEGRNRQIRRMCEKLGYQVKTLKRIRIMNIKLRDLGEGNWRYLSKNERRELLDSLS